MSSLRKTGNMTLTIDGKKVDACSSEEFEYLKQPDRVQQRHAKESTMNIEKDHTEDRSLRRVFSAVGAVFVLGLFYYLGM